MNIDNLQASTMSSNATTQPGTSAQGRGRAASMRSSGHPPPQKRRAQTPSLPGTAEMDVSLNETINDDVDPHGGADSGGSVYRSNQLSYFVSCGPNYHHRIPLTIIDINLAHYDPVLTAMYNAFLHTGYAAASAFIPITLANFIRVARLCLKARIDFVFMRQTGAKALDRVNLNQAPEMPRCLAELVNGIGFISAWQSFQEVCPHAQQEEEDLNARAARTPANIVAQFTLFVKNLAMKGLTTLVPLSRTEDGTRYWLMQVRDVVILQPQTANGHAEIVNCRTQLSDTTPADIMLAAIAQNGFDGVIPSLNFFVYESDAITGIAAIRTKFFLTK